MLVAFSVAPSGTGDSVAGAVADAVAVVRESGLPNSTDSMFTTIEGEWERTGVLAKGGPPLWDAFMDELRETHLGPQARRKQPPDGPTVRAYMEAAYTAARGEVG